VGKKSDNILAYFDDLSFSDRLANQNARAIRFADFLF